MSEETNTEAAADNTKQTVTEEKSLLATGTEETTGAESTKETVGEKPLLSTEAEEASKTVDGDGKEKETKEEAEKEEGEVIEYSDFDLPEGFVMDEKLQEAIMPILAKNGITQEVAQSLVTAQCEIRKAEAQEQAEAAQAANKQMVDGWRESIVSDPNFSENKGWAAKGIARLSKGEPEIASLFNDKVLGNMPGLYKIAASVGKLLEAEGKLLSGDKGGDGGEKTLAETLYAD
jgi:hypothetical protein